MTLKDILDEVKQNRKTKKGWQILKKSQKQNLINYGTAMIEYTLYQEASDISKFIEQSAEQNTIGTEKFSDKLDSYMRKYQTNSRDFLISYGVYSIKSRDIIKDTAKKNNLKVKIYD